MATSRASRPVKRERQRITRTACERCREKRAKCDGEKPCGRCKTRNHDCHFTQRTCTSKRSLQDEAASLREQVHRGDRVIDAISAPDASGDDILRMLREGGLTYDQAYERLRGTSEASGMNIYTTVGEGDRNRTGSCEYETCWSPSAAYSTMLSSASRHSPFSFMDYALSDDTISQPSSISEEMPPQPSNLQQRMDPMQSIPWASSAPAVKSFGTLLEGTTITPTMSTGIAGDCPTIIDPMLWPPISSSDLLGQPFRNSWTGLMADPTDALKTKTGFPCMG